MNTVIIGIAGGTASGKTTIAKKLFDKSQKYGTVTMIRLDDYYKEQINMTLEQRSEINYDHPNAYDVDLLVEHLNLLKQNKVVKKPTYDFVIHNRSEVTENVNPANVIIVEGIMTFAIPKLRELLNIKIFVDTPDDVRFIRRLQRDTTDRGRTMESVINQYLTTVRPMHLSFVEPSKEFADIIIPEGGSNRVAIDVVVAKIIDILKNN